MKKKNKVIIGIIIFIVVIAIITVIAVNLRNTEIEKQKQALNTYISNINDKKYEEMYEMISASSKETISKEDFVKRNQNIHEGIEATNVKVEILDIKDEDKAVKIEYKESMVTSAGEVNFSNTVNLVKQGNEYKINWSSNLIYPQLGDTDKIRVKTLKAKRGSILDRNMEKLAYDGQASSVGIVPRKLGNNKNKSIAKISEILGVSEDSINKSISASYVKDDTFVPIKKIAYSKTDVKEQLLSIPGVMITNIDSRVYDLGEEAAHVVGYVQSINAEDLEKNTGKGYTSSSVIGKTGLEFAYEDKLRGIDGAEIYIEDKDGKKGLQLTVQQKQDGKDVQLTIDKNTQKQLYKQLKDDKGFFVVMEPSTGEMLALVSTPSYDSNDFTLGMSNDKWNELNSNTSKPLYNRFLQSYCPGSTFKPITGAIGVTTGDITPDYEVSYTGKSWQKDASWGNYNITTLTAYNGKKNVQNALIYSDNIFFAQTALKIGNEKFVDNLKKLEFNEQIEFPLSLKKSTYSDTDTMIAEINLADTGYGQGKLLVNPIHMAAMYSAIANEGQMMKPVIEYDKNNTGKILKKDIFTKEAAEEIQKGLIQVVESPAGTAHDAKVTGLTIAGKTGTAELKVSSEDKESGTLGWFNCYTINREKQNLLIIGMVENAQDNSDGGSHYVIRKIKSIL